MDHSAAISPSPSQQLEHCFSRHHNVNPKDHVQVVGADGEAGENAQPLKKRARGSAAQQHASVGPGDLQQQQAQMPGHPPLQQHPDYDTAARLAQVRDTITSMAFPANLALQRHSQREQTGKAGLSRSMTQNTWS